MISKIYLEAGLNHFGSEREAKTILNFFLDSQFKYLSFMLHRKEFYEYQIKKNKINFFLSKKFYIDALRLAHKKGKKIGLAVCDNKTFIDLEKINFDFYKILGVSINDNSLIKKILEKNKFTFISLAKGSDENIKKCLSQIKYKRKIKLIYTSMSYDPKDTSLSRISYLKEKFKLPVGYGHHYRNINTIILSTFFDPSFYFFYIKRRNSNKKKVYPDNDHAFFFDELNELIDIIKESTYLVNNKKINTKIKLDAEKIKK